MIPPGLLFVLGLLSVDGYSQIVPKWPPPEIGMLLNNPESFAFSVLPSQQQAMFTPVFPGCPPRTAVRFDPDSYGAFALPWDPVHVKVCVRMVSPFPPVPWSSCTQAPLAFNARCSGGSFSPCQIPAHVGLRALTPVGESL